MLPTLTKTCSRCGEEKLIVEFSQRTRSKDGLQAYCKSCSTEKARAWAIANPERIAAHDRAYRIASPEKYADRQRTYCASNAEKVAAYYRARYIANREKAIAYARVYRSMNQEKVVAYARAYRADNPDVMAANDHNRRARKLGNGGTHTAADIRAQYDRQRGCCYYCDVKVDDDYHVDHVTPLAKGGSNGPENLVIACSTCNLEKHAKHPMEYCGRML